MTAPALDVPLFDHSDEVARLVARFEDGTRYASRLPFEEALVAMREGILRVNAAHGVATTPTGGYHETITRFYLLVISGYVAEEAGEAGVDWAARANRLLARYGARDLPLRHYTKALLISADARFGWVEPDLRPIA